MNTINSKFSYNYMKKVIVITGGNSGLGKETAKILSNGNKVIILGKNEKEVLKVSKGFRCDGFVCDVTNIDQVKNIYSQIIKKYKKVDCLINCAGVWIEGEIEKNDPKEIKNTILVNVFGTMLTVNVFVSIMKKQKKGKIINVISQAGLKAKKERSVYNSSKWAITGFTKCLQEELMPFRVSVSGFYPGFIHTRLFEKAGVGVKYDSRSMPVSTAAKMLVFLVNSNDDLVIKELGIQSIKQT